MSEEMVMDLVARRGSCKTIRREDVRKLSEEVRDTSGGGEERCTERAGGDGRRTRRRTSGWPHPREGYDGRESRPEDQDKQTGTNWNSKLQEPKRRGKILEPEQDKEDPSAVKSFTPEVYGYRQVLEKPKRRYRSLPETSRKRAGLEDTPEKNL